MPHSTQNSQDSRNTFDLTPEERPMIAHTNGSAHAHADVHNNPPGAFGVAVTSSSANDERAKLPSQRNWRRKSTPGTIENQTPEVNGYAFEEIMAQRKASDRTSMRSMTYDDRSKRRSQYHEEQFEYKDNARGSTRERIMKHSPVIAELKTNVIIKDEFTLVTDLSHHLAQRYTRPDSSIMIRVDHSACLAMGGTFEPCYHLTLNAVPSLMGPSTNKRNAALIQAFMAEILSVPAERGIVTFASIPEESLAISGNTVLGEIEKIEKSDSGAMQKAINDAKRRSAQLNKKSVSKLDEESKTNGYSTQANGVKENSHAQAAAALNGTLSEKASSEMTKDGRPSTAHGSSFDGLRMNGVSTDQLTGKSAKMPNGRPKSFGASPPSTSIQEQIKKEPIPSQISRQSTNQSTRSSTNGTTSTQAQSQASSQRARHVPITPRPTTLASSQQPSTASMPKSSLKTTPNTSTNKPLPSQPEKRTKNTYLDGVSNLSNKNDPPTIKIDDADSKDNKKSSKDKDKDTAANTAKRRSTITATPKLPSVPPPPAEPIETRSMSSRLGKRKSLMKIFKRESVPAWYKQ